MIRPLRSLRTCLLLFALAMSFGAVAQEICDNAIDDDGDGLVDLNDSLDCACGRILVVDSAVNSLIINPSFELYDSLPTTISQLDRCTGWRQASFSTTDYYHALSFPKPGVPLPLPDGDAFVGFLAIHNLPGPGIPYYEYLGTNLLQPLQAGVPYVLRAYMTGGSMVDTVPFALAAPWFGPLNITIFGQPTPATFPAFEFGCAGEYGWLELGHATYQAEQQWSVLTIAFTPTVDIASIMIGPPCNTPPDHVPRYNEADTLKLGVYYPYYIIDDLVLNTQDQFTGVISAEGGLCAHDLVLTAHAPPNTVTYQWYLDGVALIGRTASALPVGVDMGPGVYTCVARNATNGCLAMEFRVAPEPLMPAITVAPITGCSPLEVAFHCSTPLASITWDFADGTTAQGPDQLHTWTEPGEYTGLSVQYTSLAGCSYDIPLNRTITVWPKPAIDIAVDLSPPYTGGETLHLTGTGGPASHWTWTFGNVPPYIALNTQSTGFTLPTAAGTYEVALYARNELNCLDTAYIRFEVPICNANTVFVPSAFSPDASGKNDRLCVYGDCIRFMSIRIFDRWGNMVYGSMDPEQCWDGLHNGEPLNAGVFMYQLQATLTTDEVVERQGNITLIR